MKLIRDQIADEIELVWNSSIGKQVHSQVDNLVLTCVQICIDSEDFQKCILLRNATKEQIQEQFNARSAGG
jgi:hypothetical protein